MVIKELSLLLWNKDSRFREDPPFHFVFVATERFKFWRIQSQERLAHVCGDKVYHSDEYVKSRLSTVFSSIRGSSKY